MTSLISVIPAAVGASTGAGAPTEPSEPDIVSGLHQSRGRMLRTALPVRIAS